MEGTMWLICSIIMFVLLLFIVKRMFKYGFFNIKKSDDIGGTFVLVMFISAIGPIALAALAVGALVFTLFRLFAVFMGAESFWPALFIEFGKEWEETIKKYKGEKNVSKK